MLLPVAAAAGLVAAALTIPPAAAAPPRRVGPLASHEPSEAVPGQLLVGYRPGVTDAARSAIHRRHGARVLQSFPEIGVDLVGLPPGMAVAAAAAAYGSERGVRYAEPNAVVRASATTPNDTSFGQQWGDANTGQSVLGTTGAVGADISATGAWGIQTGSSAVTVAVIDTGIDTGHPDLAQNVDLADAHNFLDNSSVVYNPSQTCTNGGVNDDHGTHVAGILGAVGNNGTGVAGVAWRVKILPLKFLGPDGSGGCGVGDDAHAILAIFYAIQKGAQIINISWGGSTAPNESLRQTLIQAGQAGILFSVAAGNNSVGQNLAASPDYPASFNLSNEIVVAASDQNDGLASFSNFGGPTALAAPGVNILSTVTRTHPTPYGYLDGTSMAAPFVTGSLALLRSQYPGATPTELKNRLLSTVDAKSAFTSTTTSGGRLNVFHAVGQVLPVVPTITGPVGGEAVPPGTTQLATWQTNVPAGNPTTPYRVEFTANALASTTYSEPFAGPGLPPNFVQPADSDRAWTFAAGQGPSGSGALRSGLSPADNNRASWVATTVNTVVPGTVSFNYKVDSEDCSAPPTNPVCGDYLQFFVDGASELMVNGAHGYSLFSFPLPPGVHRLSWAYQKDVSTSVGMDAAWIAGLAVSGVDNAQWTTVATAGTGATSVAWTTPSHPTFSAKLRVCQDSGGACGLSTASASPGVFSVGLVLTRPEGLGLTEGGAAASYSVSLLTTPTAPVIITLDADPQLSVNPSSLVFTAANTPQSVTVGAPDDQIAQPPSHTVSIQQTAASSDPAYSNTAVAAVGVTIADTDTAAVFVNDGAGITLVPGGASGTYTVVLASKPSAPVTVAVSPDAALKVSPSSLTFDAGNWSVAQTVAVVALTGGAPVARNVGIAHSVSSPDPTYNGIATLAARVHLLAPPASGYWLVASDGGIFAFGGSHFFGSTGSIHLNKPIVAAMATPTGAGYWLVASDGGIFAFGDAVFAGSTGSIHLNRQIVAAMPTPTGAGYWLVASDGGIFAFGDAQFFGSTGSIHLNQPIVAAMATPTGAGYWLVASDGGIFAFGDAVFAGSTGSIHLNRQIVAAMATPTGAGYWLVASDGGIFAFADGPFFGSTGSIHLNEPIVASMAR